MNENSDERMNLGTGSEHELLRIVCDFCRRISENVEEEEFYRALYFTRIHSVAPAVASPVDDVDREHHFCGSCRWMEKTHSISLSRPTGRPATRSSS